MCIDVIKEISFCNSFLQQQVNQKQKQIGMKTLSPDTKNSTNDSFFTPNKNYNPSSLQTNPSATLNNFQSANYTSVELSESLGTSPSFYSPSKQLPSLLITPNSSQSSPLKGRFQSLQIESNTKNDQNQSFVHAQQPETQAISQSEIQKLFELKKILNFQSRHSQGNEQTLTAMSSRHELLSEKVLEKQSQVYSHKKRVERLIKVRNELRNKIKSKTAQRKLKEDRQNEELHHNIKKFTQEISQREKDVALQHMKIKRQAEILEDQIQKAQQRKSLSSQNNCPLPGYLPGFLQNGSFLPQYPTFPGQNFKPQFGNTGVPPQQAENFNSLETYQNPRSHGEFYESGPSSSRGFDSGRRSFHLRGDAKEEDWYEEYLRNNNLRMSTQKISPIANSRNNEKLRQMFSDQRQLTELEQEHLSGILNSIKKSDNPESPFKQSKIRINNLEELYNSHKKEEVSKNNSQSVIDIHVHSNSKAESREPSYMLKDDTFSVNKESSEADSAQREQPKRFSLNEQMKPIEQLTHRRNMSNPAVEGSQYSRPVSFVQSRVNIEYQSEQTSGKFESIESPRKGVDDSTEKRKRSSTFKVPNTLQLLEIKEEAEKHVRKESRSEIILDSGEDTPVFRIQDQNQLRFSKPLLLESQKGSQNYQESVTESPRFDQVTATPEPPKTKFSSSEPCLEVRKRTKEDEYMKTSTKLNNEKDEDDDDFYSCTLGAESKIHHGSESQSKFDFLNEESSENLKNSERDENFEEMIKEMEEDDIRKSTPSTIIQAGRVKPDGSIRNTLGSLSKMKKSAIETVVQESEDEDENSKPRETDRPRFDLSKSTF